MIQKAKAGFTFGSVGPSGCIRFDPRLSGTELPDAPESNKRVVPVFQSLDHLLQNRQPRFPEPEKRQNPMGREVWDLVVKGSWGRIICTEMALYQLHPLTPSRSTETMPWPGPNWEG